VKAAAILLCAGKGERLGAGVPKAMAPLAGRPLFAWSLEALVRTPAIEGIAMVGPVRPLRELVAATGLATARIVAWSEGGRERQHSVGRGLHALPPEFDLVAVHDCARALVTPEVIARVVGDAAAHGAALAAIPLDDTLKRATLHAVDATVPRAGLWRAQTPQAFRRDWLEAAHAQAAGVATDDAALVEALGHPVRITPGDRLNFKITTADDLRESVTTSTGSRRDVRSSWAGSSSRASGGSKGTATPTCCATRSATRCSARRGSAISAGTSRPTTRSGRTPRASTCCG
jgi:2-C-methyl-D-erythritol 4-phosphate cytidylyltransferase